MLGTLLEKLQSLFSKSFAVGSIPLLAFLVLHSLMAYRVSAHVQKWFSYYLSLDTAHVAELSFLLLLLVVILSYVFSTLNVSLREALEGKHLFGESLPNILSQHYRDRLMTIEEKLDQAKKERRAIREDQDAWERIMGDAYKAGKTRPDCNYQRRQQLNQLFDRRDGNQMITAAELKAEVDAMKTFLENNNPELNQPQSINLDKDHGALLRLIRYALDKWNEQRVAYLNRLQFDYAGRDVAPTKMGNISKAAPYYAASRYSLNLDIFWTRLQKVIQADTNFYGLLQDAKLQLDFLVSLVWLTLTFTVIWVIVLPCVREAMGLFLLIAIAGPVLTYIWYVVALQNYRAFSDLLRASVDLYRLDLLKVLRIPLPANAEQERELWDTLEQRFAYGERSNLLLVQKNS